MGEDKPDRYNEVYALEKMEEEVIQEYRSSLEELTANSKPLINMLTMLAEDNEQYAPEIVKVIETHLQQVYLNFIFNRVSI